MLRDYVRVMAYRTAIFAAARDRVVVDLGCGSGILSLFAAQAGARHVYAIEETKVAGLAALMFKANGFGDRITLLRGNSRELELPERADLIVHEQLGVDPFDENILATIEDARRRFLAPGGVLLPDSFEVWCVGVELPQVPSPTERILCEAREFSRIYGLDFTPYVMALEAYRDALAINTGRPAGTETANRILTEPCLLRSVDMTKEPLETEAPTQLEVASDGFLDGLLIYFRAPLGDIVLTNSPFTPTTAWGWAVRDLGQRRLVRTGERVALRSRLAMIDERSRLIVELNDRS
jgi:protein arginine N-methyltransferase 1